MSNGTWAEQSEPFTPPERIASSVVQAVDQTHNCPHDWLFKHVSCVVHHGGAGTTAVGLAAGKPSVVAPFFGNQLFWGKVVTEAGVASAPIPSKSLTAASLAAIITDALAPSISENARILAGSINSENGAKMADYHCRTSVVLWPLRARLYGGINGGDVWNRGVTVPVVSSRIL